MRKIKILYVVPSLSKANGVASYVMNYYRKFEKGKIQCDFLLLHKRENFYKEEIEKNTDNVFEISIEECNKNIIKFNNKVKKFFKQHNDYDIIHCNVANLGVFVLYHAKKNNIKVRILHAHATKTADNFYKKFRNDLIMPFVKKLANHFFSCSNLAGINTFGNKTKFDIVNNAIDIEKYKFDSNKRKELRNKLKIEDKFVIGNIGRLCNQKNQKYLLGVFKEILQINNNSVLIIIGNGPLEEELKQQSRNLNIDDKVMFLGKADNPEDYYQIFDLFVLTSFYEGLPVVGIEAQAAGIKCAFSDKITKEVNFNDDNLFFSIEDSYKKTAENIIKLGCNDIERCCPRGIIDNYDINKCTRGLQKKYIELIESEKI